MREAIELLPRAGIANESTAVQELTAQVRGGFVSKHTPSGVHTYFVPGRIEVLGKHTDYAGGRSLTCATDRGICIGVAPTPERRLEVVDLTREVATVVDLGDPGEPHAYCDWRRYVVAAAWRLREDYGAPLHGARVALASNLPRAAGISSSSALVVALGVALASAGCFELRQGPRIDTLEELAGYLGALESGRQFGSSTATGGVGTFGGSEDHTAILCSRPGELRCWRYDPIVLLEDVPLPPDYRFVVAVSGVHASKTGEARQLYNRASGLAAAAAEVWRRESGSGHRHLAAAIAARGARAVRTVIAGGKHDRYEIADLLERFDHLVVESETIVPEAIAALRDGDLERFGEIVARSQRRCEEKLHNQVPETIHLAKSARESGAVAASAFGAGFGGSVWALVSETPSEAFVERWRQAYAARFPERRDSLFFSTRPASGARRLA